MKYLEYLKELRNRLLFSFSFMFLCFLFFFLNIGLVIETLTNPLYELLNNQENKRMIFTGLPEVFVSNLKVSFFVAFLFSLPIFIIQIILFTSPALYKKEKKVFVLVSIMSIIFFFLGILFAYFFLIPMIWSFFISYESFVDGSLPIQLESRYSEFYILNSEGLSADYPQSMGPDDSETVLIGIENLEGLNLNYTIVIKHILYDEDPRANRSIGDKHISEQASSSSLSIQDGQTRQVQFPIGFESEGLWIFKAELTRGEPFLDQEPYREVYLWVSVE